VLGTCDLAVTLRGRLLIVHVNCVYTDTQALLPYRITFLSQASDAMDRSAYAEWSVN
jgi:hypothetical protein